MYVRNNTRSERRYSKRNLGRGLAVGRDSIARVARVEVPTYRSAPHARTAPSAVRKVEVICIARIVLVSSPYLDS